MDAHPGVSRRQANSALSANININMRVIHVITWLDQLITARDIVLILHIMGGVPQDITYIAVSTITWEKVETRTMNMNAMAMQYSQNAKISFIS